MEMTEAKNARLVINWIKTGIHVLSARAVLLLSLLLGSGLFAYGLYDPSWQRCVMLGTYCLLVFIPLVRLDAAQAPARQIIEGE